LLELSVDKTRANNPNDHVSSSDVLGTSSYQYCPKPAYGTIYDALTKGLSKIYLSIVFMNTDNEGLVAGVDPYPGPEVSIEPPEDRYPGPVLTPSNP
jgi:hypothetical protein